MRLLEFPHSRQSRRQDVITRDEMEIMVRMQAEAWQAESVARQRFTSIEERLQHGAIAEDCEYYVDINIRVVRNRKRFDTCALTESK